MKNLVPAAAVLIIMVVVGAALYLMQPTTPTGEGETEGEFRVFNMTTRQWSFDPSTITVSQSDNAQLKITSQDVTHGIAIPDFGIDVVLPSGETVTVEFFAENTGTYSFYCSVNCGAGHSDMVGQLIVQ